MLPCYANRCEAIFLAGKCVVVVRNHTRNGEGKSIAKMGLSDLKSFGLEVIQVEVDKAVDHHLQFYPVIPVKTGIQGIIKIWIPASGGMTCMVELPSLLNPKLFPDLVDIFFFRHKREISDRS